MTAKRMTRSGVPPFNHYAVLAIYRFEMERARRTLWQSLVTPIITTSLYFIVFGAAIGSRISEVDGVSYGAFIVPMIMLSLFTGDVERFVRNLSCRALPERFMRCYRHRCRRWKWCSAMSERPRPSRSSWGQ